MVDITHYLGYQKYVVVSKYCSSQVLRPIATYQKYLPLLEEWLALEERNIGNILVINATFW